MGCLAHSFYIKRSELWRGRSLWHRVFCFLSIFVAFVLHFVVVAAAAVENKSLNKKAHNAVKGERHKIGRIGGQDE